MDKNVIKVTQVHYEKDHHSIVIWFQKSEKFYKKAPQYRQQCKKVTRTL